MIGAVVVLADVKGSRRRSDRVALGRRIPASLRDLNRRHKAGLLGSFDVQKGLDEFAGVLRVGADVGRVVLDLWETLHPVEVRMAVVKGTLDVVPRRAPRGSLPSARLFDGDAFHRGARLLEETRSKGWYLGLDLGTVEPGEECLRHLGNLACAHLVGMTPRQLQVFQVFRSTGSQRAAAERLRITQPAVSAALARTRARMVMPALDHLARQLTSAAGGAP